MDDRLKYKPQNDTISQKKRKKSLWSWIKKLYFRHDVKSMIYKK